MRRLVARALLVGLAIALGAPAGALGHWRAPGSGQATAAGATLAAAAISVPASATSGVVVSWAQQATLVPAASTNASIIYSVERRAGTGAFAPIETGGCAGPLPRGTPTCNDRPPASGSYAYRVVARLNSWTATSPEAGPLR